MVLVFLISEGSVFHNLGADKENARSAVLLSALEIVFGTNKEILFRERRPGREGTRRRIGSIRLFLSKWSVSCMATTFSQSLEMKGKLDIGR